MRIGLLHSVRLAPGLQRKNVLYSFSSPRVRSELNGIGGALSAGDDRQLFDCQHRRRIALRFEFGKIEFDFSYVATNQMGDRSAREPMKVVPSRDITTGRRKEPMNRGLPNGTSLPQGNSHYAKGYLPN